MKAVINVYARETGRSLLGCDTEGRCGVAGVLSLGILCRARAEALREAVRWGEPYVFYTLPGVMSWVVPIVSGDSVFGGLVETGVADADSFDAAAARRYLCRGGCREQTAELFVAQLERGDSAAIWKGADFVRNEFYARSGFRPALLERNRENAWQQRQIGEAIQSGKTQRLRVGMDDERALLALIKVGDRAGARGMLNRMLAAMFLYSPRFAVVQARSIEMMGFLVRAAVEDSPLQDVLMDRHQRWVVAIVDTQDFETLCGVLREALDDFMDSVSLQGFNRTSVPVGKALRYVAAHVSERVSLEEVARHVGLSKYRLAHLIKETTGYPLMQHLKRLRVQRAARLLESGTPSMSQLAYDLGFSDQSHFTRQFREIMGVTPGVWHRRHHRG